MPPLAGSQLKQLQDALLSAFPSSDALGQMLRFELNESLEAIAGTGPLSTVAFKLIQWAESHGRTGDLVRGARRANPGNISLRDVAAALGFTEARPARTAGARTRHDLFLAHASPDKPSAETLYDLLQPDVSVFLDCRSLLPGDEWDLEIPAAQRASLASVILISRRVDPSWFLREEIHSAIALQRAAPGEHRLLPVVLERGVEPPYGLRIVQAIDAITEGGLPGVAARLREAVARLRGLPPPGAIPAAIPPAIPPAAPPAGAAPACDERRLYGRLIRLLDPQFEEVLFLAGVERRFIKPTTAPLAERALDLAQLAALDLALCRRLSALLDERAPWTR